MPTYLNAAMSQGLLVTENKLSELAVDAATQEVAMDNIGFQYAIPIGTIIPYAGTVLPVGFLTCNGAAVSRTGYAALFSITGTRYGTGNGSTTFNLPNVTAGLTLSASSVAYIVKYDNVSGILESP